MAAPRSVEERGLVDDVRALGDRFARRCGRRAQLVAAVLDRAVELDVGHGLSFGAQLVEEALLVLEPALADDVQLGVDAFRAHRHTRHRGALELREMLARQEANKVRGGVDRLAVDRLHVALTIRATRVSLPVTRPLRFAHGGQATRRRGQALGRSDVGEHRRAADPRGDGRTARSTSCHTRGSGCRSRTTPRPGSARSGSGCCAMRAWRRRGSRRTRRSATCSRSGTPCWRGRRRRPP